MLTGAQLGLDTDDGVWPDNIPAVAAFLAVATQWRMVAGDAGSTAIGLDYAGARAGLDASGIAVTPDLWTGLRLVESGALSAMNERRG